MIPNNYMFVFDPHPGRANSVAPGKRVTSSMSPVIVLRDGKPRFALGLPGGLRIFPSVMQAVCNLIDHGMTRAGGGRGAAPLDPGLRRGDGDGVLRPTCCAALRDRGHDVAAYRQCRAAA